MNNPRVIPVIESGPYTRLHIGSKSRENTLTDVKFYNEDTLVAANRDKRLVYLISIKDPEARILDKIELEKSVWPDLIEVYGDTVYIVTLSGNVYVCKIIDGVKLKYEKYILINDACKYHGVKVNLQNPSELWFSSSYKTYGMISLYNLTTRACKNFAINDLRDYRLKDVGLISPELVIITGSSSSGQPKPIPDPFHSLVNLYYWDGSQFIYLDGFRLETCQTDCIAVKDNIAFITAQLDNRGVIVRVKVENNKLVRLDDIVTTDFPHGMGMAPSQTSICYSSYATSCAYIIPIE